MITRPTAEDRKVLAGEIIDDLTRAQAKLSELSRHNTFSFPLKMAHELIGYALEQLSAGGGYGKK